MVQKNTATVTRSYAKRLLAFLIIAIVVMAGVHLWLQHLNLNVYSELNGRIYELSNRVDFDDEVSVPTWFSQALFLAIAGSCFLLAYMQKVPAARRLWIFLGGLGLIMSIDEVSALHELLLQTTHLLLFGETGPTIIANAWVAFLPIIIIASIIVLRYMFKYLPARTIWLCAFGGFIFVSGAVFIDILTSADLENTFYNKGILAAIEESLELLGSSIILYAFVDHIEKSYGDRIKNALKQLKA